MKHCAYTQTSLADALGMSRCSVGSWASTNRKKNFMPGKLTAVLVWRVLLDTWPKDKSGKHIPIPTMGEYSRPKLLRLILDNVSQGIYTTTEIVTSSKGDLREIFEAYTPTFNSAAIGREISATAEMSGGRIRDVTGANKAALWLISDSTQAPEDENISTKIDRIESLIETLIKKQSKLLREWGLE